MEAFEMALLFDYYGAMLTEKQREYLDMRYNQDMSLSEIAEVQKVSRQAVFDNLSRTEAQLLRMEEKIGCIRRDRAVDKAAQRLRSALELMEGKSDPEVMAAASIVLDAVQRLEE